MFFYSSCRPCESGLLTFTQKSTSWSFSTSAISQIAEVFAGRESLRPATEVFFHGLPATRAKDLHANRPRLSKARRSKGPQCCSALPQCPPTFSSWRTRSNLRLAGCGKSLPPQDAAIGDPQKPRLFGVSPKWKKAMNGFFHGQLDGRNCCMRLVCMPVTRRQEL